jgi:hypothetical protein
MKVTVLAAVAVIGMVLWQNQASTPLASWNDGSAKQSIVDVVRRVTSEGGPDFVPVPQRIAVFDNDGTLWAEQPFYVQGLFVFDRVCALEPKHPAWKDTQPFKAALERDLKTLAAAGVPALTELVMATHAGITTEEFEGTVKQWLAADSASDIQQAVHRPGVSTDAGVAGLPSSE